MSEIERASDVRTGAKIESCSSAREALLLSGVQCFGRANARLNVCCGFLLSSLPIVTVNAFGVIMG